MKSWEGIKVIICRVERGQHYLLFLHVSLSAAWAVVGGCWIFLFATSWQLSTDKRADEKFCSPPFCLYRHCFKDSFVKISARILLDQTNDSSAPKEVYWLSENVKLRLVCCNTDYKDSISLAQRAHNNKILLTITVKVRNRSHQLSGFFLPKPFSKTLSNSQKIN